MRGKVCDNYDLGDGTVLSVRTDRLSARDVVLQTSIRNKGKVLHGLSMYWFKGTGDIVGNHVVTDDIGQIMERIGRAGAHDALAQRADLDGRSMIIRKAKVFGAEFIVRGYIFGSMYDEYLGLCKNAPEGTKTVNWRGFDLSVGMKQGAKLPEPILTSSTKAADGAHDVNISFEELCDLIGDDAAIKIRGFALALYARAAEEAAKKGIILCDTKFEFGVIDGQIVLIDEVLTPDSSRYWDAKTYEPGQDQPSFDKEPVRLYLDELCKQELWDKEYPGPAIPAEVSEKTTERYVEAYRRITGGCELN